VLSAGDGKAAEDGEMALGIGPADQFTVRQREAFPGEHFLEALQVMIRSHFREADDIGLGAGEGADDRGDFLAGFWADWARVGGGR
jgi:hypothetical protein